MSSKSKRPTGLGTGAFFNASATEAASSATTPAETEKKMRTTIMLPPDVVAGIEALRTQARKGGTRLTTSQIIEDALKLLMRERKIEI